MTRIHLSRLRWLHGKKQRPLGSLAPVLGAAATKLRHLRGTEHLRGPCINVVNETFTWNAITHHQNFDRKWEKTTRRVDAIREVTANNVYRRHCCLRDGWKICSSGRLRRRRPNMMITTILACDIANDELFFFWPSLLPAPPPAGNSRPQS